MEFNLHTWNVNSIRARSDQVIEWLELENPDVFGLQETKVTDDNFPVDLFTSRGYEIVFFGQKTYNGVAIGYKKNKISSPIETVKNNPFFPDDQSRIISTSFQFSKEFKLRIICVYVPNGSSLESEKFNYKINFLKHLIEMLKKELNENNKICLLGDFNIAPSDIDVHDPIIWNNKILCSPEERQLFNELLSVGLVDSYRQLNPDKKIFSWWDYRQAAFRRNLGLRIDHLLVSDELMKYCFESDISIKIRKQTKPSDHAPCWIKINTS